MEQKLPHNTEISASRQLKIEECLLRKMESTPYDRISITDLCRQMGISRQLFYTYFPDKDACLHSLIDRLLQDSIDEMYFSSYRDNLYDVSVSYLSYWRKHSDFLDVIVRQQMKSLVVERNYLYFKKHYRDMILMYLSTPDVEADESILWLYNVIRFITLMQWHESGYALPVEKMATKYLRILKEPLLKDDQQWA